MKKVVIAGQGYVGLPLAMRAVEVGFSVVGLEVSPYRLAQLQTGTSYVEDISSERLGAALASGHYLPTDDMSKMSGFDVAVITVPTPMNEGKPDLSFVEEAAHEIAQYVTAGSTIILESTTYPGTTIELLVPILETGSGLRAESDFFVGFSPERIDPGNLIWHFENTPKIVSGVGASSLQHVSAFYEQLVEKVVPVAGTREAELAKLVENTFRFVNIALINELAMFAGAMGIDIWEVIDAADSKPFGFMKFSPGPGVGGHCLPIDPSYLSWKVEQSLGAQFRFIELSNDVNNHMPAYVARRVGSMLNKVRKSVKGSKILVLGLSYKKNSSDIRESPSIDLCRILTDLGADLRVVDPMVDTSNVPADFALVTLTAEELAASDLVIVVTDHDDIDWDLVGEHATMALDTRHRLPPHSSVEYL